MFDKPLFSRRQLSLIMLITVIAIVLLTASGQRPALPEIQQQQQHGVPVYWLEKDTESSHLSLDFALPKDTRGDSTAVRLVQQLLLDSLRQNVQQPSVAIKLNSHSDRLQITLTAPAGQSLAAVLPPVFKQLQSAVNTEKWHKLRQKQQAQQYLDTQSADPGWSQMHSWLRPPQSKYHSDYTRWSNFREQLFSRSQLSVALMAEDTETLLSALQEPLSSMPSGLERRDPVPITLPPQRQQLSTLGEYQLLLGRHTSGRAASDFAQQLLAVRQLQKLAGALHIYSEWRPLGHDSELILRASSPSVIDTTALLDAITTRLAKIPDEELDSNRAKTIDHLYQRLENPNQLFEQLQAIAFYQLPVNYLDSFVSQIDQLSSSGLRQRIGDLLHSEHYHQISLQPAR